MNVREFATRADWAMLSPTTRVRVRLGKKPFSRPLTVECAVFMKPDTPRRNPLLLTFEGGQGIAVVEQDFKLEEPAGEDVPVLGDIVRDRETGKLLIVSAITHAPDSGFAVGGLTGRREYLRSTGWSPTGRHFPEPKRAGELTWTLLLDGEDPKA